MKKLRKLFEVPLYVKVFENRFEIDNVANGSATASSPAEAFTTRRLLIGNFRVAEACLRQAVGRVIPTGFIKRRPAIMIHPLAMTEDGLSEVEERVLRELAFGAGAHRVVTHVGEQLTPEKVVEKLNQT